MNKEGLLVNRALREVVCFDKVLRYDWVHSALQDGMLTIEIWLFVEKCESLELLSFADLEQYLKSQQEIAARTKARAASAPAAAGAAPTTAATEATPERG